MTVACHDPGNSKSHRLYKRVFGKSTPDHIGDGLYLILDKKRGEEQQGYLAF